MAKKPLFILHTLKDVNKFIRVATKFSYEGDPITECDATKLHARLHPVTASDYLDKWLDDNREKICSVGRRKLLKSVGTTHSWFDYCKNHWDDEDGAFDWFRTSHGTLLKNWDNLIFFHFMGTKLSFDEFIKSNGLKRSNFCAWPFPKTLKARKKVVRKRR